MPWVEAGIDPAQMIKCVRLHSAAGASASLYNCSPKHLQLDGPETGRVADHTYRGQGHGCGGDDGREQDAEERIKHTGCNWYAERIVDEREEQVLPDVAHRGLR